MQNYFELFALVPQFDLDTQALESAYQTSISQYHPDRFADKSEAEQLSAVQNTSLINTAFNTLKAPLERARYLLELQGVNAFDETDTRMDMDFLLAQIELRESLETIKANQDELALDDFIETVSGKIKDNIAHISQGFQAKDLDGVRNLVRELKFYTQLQQQAKALMDEFL